MFRKEHSGAATAAALHAWLLAAPHAGLALAASSVTNLLLLVPTLITLQVYDRVLSSRRTETLLMLLLAAALSLLAWWMVETARVRWLSARATELEHEIASKLTPYILNAPSSLASGLAPQLWRDLVVCRALLAGPVLVAITDSPWSLVYLLLISAFHPLLGAIALLGIVCLIALASLTEWRLRAPTASVEHAQERFRRDSAEIAAFNEVMQLAQRDLASNQKLRAEGFVSEARLAGLQRVVADSPQR